MSGERRVPACVFPLPNLSGRIYAGSWPPPDRLPGSDCACGYASLSGRVSPASEPDEFARRANSASASNTARQGLSDRARQAESDHVGLSRTKKKVGFTDTCWTVFRRVQTCAETLRSPHMCSDLLSVLRLFFGVTFDTRRSSFPQHGWGGLPVLDAPSLDCSGDRKHGAFCPALLKW